MVDLQDLSEQLVVSASVEPVLMVALQEILEQLVVPAPAESGSMSALQGLLELFGFAGQISFPKKQA